MKGKNVGNEEFVKVMTNRRKKVAKLGYKKFDYCKRRTLDGFGRKKVENMRRKMDYLGRKNVNTSNQPAFIAYISLQGSSH